MFIKKNKIILFLVKTLWIILPLLFNLNLSFLSGQNKEEKTEAGKIPPLIKINLLSGKEISLPPVIRDIFSPQASSTNFSPSFSQKQDSKSGQKWPDELSEEGMTSNEFISRPVVRYIGYIHSARNVIALLVVNGLALPVEEGEYIAPEFQVLRITPEEVIVAGPDRKEIRFSFEGEKNEKT